MSFSVEDLYRAREFIDIKNVYDDRAELCFKNPIIALLAKGKISEISEMFGPDEAFQSCEQDGSDLVLRFNPKLVDPKLLEEIFTAQPDRAEQAAKELASYIEERKNA